MPAVDIESLLRPTVADPPCGPDLEYDRDHMALVQLLSDRAPDWSRVQALALPLLARTKDLRVAVPLWRAWARRGDLAERIDGFASGLVLVARLLENHWAEVHPLLDADDGDDPTIRVNALMPLAQPHVLGELRAVFGTTGNDGVAVIAPQDAPVTELLARMAPEQCVQATRQLRTAAEAAAAIDWLLLDRVGSWLDLGTLVRCTRAWCGKGPPDATPTFPAVDSGEPSEPARAVPDHATSLDIESLLAPVSEDAPCGPDLEYEPESLRLYACAEGRPEQEWGGFTASAVPPDWPVVQTLAMQLLQRTKDLRVAVLLWRAMVRIGDLAGRIDGFADGLVLIERLLACYWVEVHPQLDASDGDDPTIRVNALAPLGLHALAELRALVGFGGAAAWRTLDPQAVDVLDRLPPPQRDAASLQLRRAVDAALAIEALMTSRTGIPLDLGTLVRCARAWNAMARPDRPEAEQVEAAPGAPPMVTASDAVRAEAAERLARACAWLDRHLMPADRIEKAAGRAP
jgi:type VI secretion system protein ImpA